MKDSDILQTRDTAILQTRCITMKRERAGISPGMLHIGALLKWGSLLAAFAILVPHSFAAGGEGPLEDPVPAQNGAGSKVRNFRMGTSTHFQQGWDVETIMPLVATLGVGWIRDEIYWNELEKVRGEYQIPARDRKWIEAANRHGLKIICLFNGGNTLYKDNFDPVAYAKAAAFVANELRGKIHAMEILNEPHNFGFSQFYGGTWNGMEKGGENSPWIAKYVNLLNQAADSIKAVNPGLKVIGLGGTAPANFRMLALPISQNVDGIVDHPYSYRTVPENVPYSAVESILKRDGIATADAQGTFVSQIEMYKARSKKFSGPKEIWLTEFGYSTYQEGVKHDTMYSGFTPEAQAIYLVRRFLEALALDVEVSIQYDFKNDGENPRNTEENFGLVSSDKLIPKPAYFALQRLASETLGWNPAADKRVSVFPFSNREERHPIEWDGALLKSPGSIRAYEFTDAKGQYVITMWSTERVGGDLQPRTADIEIHFDGAAPRLIEITNLYSGEKHRVPVKIKNGVVLMEQVSIPASPLIFRFGL
jgi:hypothetical protein